MSTLYIRYNFFEKISNEPMWYRPPYNRPCVSPHSTNMVSLVLWVKS